MGDNKIMRILREVNGYTQEYVASELRINQNTYSKLESGQTKLTVERVRLLAELYKIDPDYFLSEEAPIINYNTGNKSRAIINTQNYNDNLESRQFQQLYEKLLVEKDQQIELLKAELSELRDDRKQMKQLIDQLLTRIKSL